MLVVRQGMRSSEQPRKRKYHKFCLSPNYPNYSGADTLLGRNIAGLL